MMKEHRLVANGQPSVNCNKRCRLPLNQRCAHNESVMFPIVDGLHCQDGFVGFDMATFVRALRRWKSRLQP